MKRAVPNLIGLIILVFLSACAGSSYITPVQTQVSPPEKVLVKNYTLNKQQSANVGDVIIKVKDYTVIRYTSDYLKASNDFHIGESDIYLNGKKDEPMKIVGVAQVKDSEYYLLITNNPDWFFPVNNDGKYLGGLAIRISGPFESGNRATIIPEGKRLKIVPDDTIFSRTKDEKIDSKSGYINYEIVYTGITKDAINFLYREFTSEDMARPAFYQNLTYPINTKTIRFKKTKIRVISINEEKINYVVEED